MHTVYILHGFKTETVRALGGMDRPLLGNVIFFIKTAFHFAYGSHFLPRDYRVHYRSMQIPVEHYC